MSNTERLDAKKHGLKSSYWIDGIPKSCKCETEPYVTIYLEMTFMLNQTNYMAVQI